MKKTAKKIHLKDIGESRIRTVLTEKDKKAIIKLGSKSPKPSAVETAKKYGVSRQRIQFLWLTPERQLEIRQRVYAKKRARFMKDKKYKSRVNAIRQEYLQHRREVLSRLNNK